MLAMAGSRCARVRALAMALTALAVTSVLPTHAGAQDVPAEVYGRPGPDRVALRIEDDRGSDTAIGLMRTRSADRPGRVTFDAAAEPPLHCRTPCDVHLAAGPLRLFAEVDGEFAWRTDLLLPPGGATRLRVHTQNRTAAASAVVLLVVSAFATLAGPAIPIARELTHQRPVGTEWIGGGAAIGAAGVGGIVGAVYLMRWASPSVVTLPAPDGGGPAAAGIGPAGLSFAF